MMMDHYERRMRDLKFAMEMVSHINNPCVCPQTGENIRHVYLKYARKGLENMECPTARAFLEYHLKKYSPDRLENSA